MGPAYGFLVVRLQHAGNPAALADDVAEQSDAGRPWSLSLQVTEARAEHAEGQLAGRMVVMETGTTHSLPAASCPMRQSRSSITNDGEE
jgi:hypothetical protein